MFFLIFLFCLYTNFEKIDYNVLEAAYNNNNYEFVISIGEIINNNETDINVLKLLARSYLKTNKNEVAKFKTNEVLRIDKNWYEGYKILSFIAYKQNNIEEAIRQIKIFDNNSKNKTIEEKYYIASIYKEANINSDELFKAIIIDIEYENKIIEYLDIYISSCENILAFEKAIKAVLLKNDSCDKFTILKNLYIKANINFDLTYEYKEYCNIEEEKLYSIDTSSNINNIHSRNFEYINFIIKNELIINNLSSYLTYNLYTYNYGISKTYNALSLGFSYLLGNINLNIEVEKYINFNPKYLPLYFNFSYFKENNNLNLYYYNHSDLFITKNFILNNIETKEFNFYNNFNYYKLFNLEFNFNYKQVFNLNNKYTNMYNTKLNIFSKITQSNPFHFGLSFNSFGIDNYNDFKDTFVKNRFINAFIFKYITNFEKGFNLETSFLLGDDINNKENFLEILELSINPSYIFNNNFNLTLNASYTTVIEAKELEYALKSTISLNYSF